MDSLTLKDRRGRKPKKFCVHGHDLSETRRRDKSGKPYCGACRDGRKRDRSKELEKQLATYGLSVYDYGTLFVTQGGVCAICGDPPGKRRLAVDHCHDTGRVRGLLCGSCNAALGLLKEEPARFESALSYIRERC